MMESTPKFILTDGEKNILKTIRDTDVFDMKDKEKVKEVAQLEFNSVVNIYKKEIKKKQKVEKLDELDIYKNLENNNMVRKIQEIIKTSLNKKADEKNAGNEHLNYPDKPTYDIDKLNDWLREPGANEEYCKKVGPVIKSGGTIQINAEKNKCILFLLSKDKESVVSGGCRFCPAGQTDLYGDLCLGCLIWDTCEAMWMMKGTQENAEEVILPFSVSAKNFNPAWGLPQINNFNGITTLFPKVQDNTFRYVKKKAECPITGTILQGYDFYYQENFSY